MIVRMVNMELNPNNWEYNPISNYCYMVPENYSQKDIYDNKISKFEEAASFVLLHEGKLSEDKSDPGGITKYGISLRYLRSIGLDIDNHGSYEEDILDLTVEQAKEIYKHNWWDKYHYGLIKSNLIARKILDMSINMGASRAHRIVILSLNKINKNDQIKISSGFDILIIDIINKSDPSLLLDALRKECATFYMDLAKEHVVLRKFLNGWIKRAYT